MYTKMKTSLIIIIVLITCATSESTLKEYCQDEKLEASCKHGEVLLFETARYGRMRISRCVTRDLGYLGCSVDARPLLDTVCSGRQSCTLSMMDSRLRDLSPCLEDVTWHLEASYTCVKVATVGRHQCSQNSPPILSHQVGYLSSWMAREHGDGSSSCPWKIQALPGQIINITTYNFLSASPIAGLEPETTSGVCMEYATVQEPGSPPRRQASCAKDGRQRVTYLSHSHSLTVTFTTRRQHNEQAQFLLRYQVMGCADQLPPAGAHSRREKDTLVVHCNATGETSYLTCDGHNWQGEPAKCPAPSKKREPWTSEDIFNTTSFPFGILIVVAVGVALGVFLGGTLLIFANLYMKRRRRRRYDSPYAPDPQSQISVSEDGLCVDRKFRLSDNGKELYNTSSLGHGTETSTLTDCSTGTGRSVCTRPGKPDYPGSSSSFPPAPYPEHTGTLSHFYESPKIS